MMVRDPDPGTLLRITICQRNKDHWLGSHVRIMYCKNPVSHPNRWRNHRGAALSETDCSEVSTTTIIQFSYITRPIPCPK